MDSHYHELNRRIDPAKLLGYLNFSDGRPDPRFQKALADAFAYLNESGDPTPWGTLPGWLLHECGELETSGSSAFRETIQARAAIEVALVRLPGSYRIHHSDLLAHQPDAALFNAFFLSRACEAVLQQGGPWDQTGRLVGGAIDRLNDYVGYRPIAVLETRPNTEYYPQEKVRPVPLYLKGAGVASGPYSDLIRAALDLLSRTEPVMLEEACFDPEKLDEMALDPRAHDHFHPINKRPNVLFGEWDPHTIDNRGYYRRFVLRQMTLDTLLTWVNSTDARVGGDRAERLFEASAVLAGTILMGAGLSGTGPAYHDSTVTLTKLVPRIARFRDGYYQQLLKVLSGHHGERLREEAEKRRQPFAGVRQFLNQAIATQRAIHLQDRRLSMLFAAMGYPSAARNRAKSISAPAVRIGTEIRIRQTEAALAADQARHAEALQLLNEVEELLRRGIECSAIIDPWNILGYQGLYPIFPSREDTVRDSRAEELLLCMGRQFDLYARAIAAAAVGKDELVRNRLIQSARELATWWDRYATPTVADLPRVHGGERADAAEHVATALAAWSQRDPTTNDLSFWRNHREGFTTPAAFSQVIEALSQHGQWRAAMGLLMSWLSESDNVPLEDASASFETLTEEWLAGVISAESMSAPDRSALIRRFFELLDANAEPAWIDPQRWLNGIGQSDDERDDDDDPDTEYESAYEGMTFRDSADDGEEGSVAGGEPSRHWEFPLETEAARLENRLHFLLTTARLWRSAARPNLWSRNDPTTGELLVGWMAKVESADRDLTQLLDQLHKIVVPEPIGGNEAMIEFDRRRALKGHLLDLTVATCIEVRRAGFALSGILVHGGELPAVGTGGSDSDETTPVRSPWLSLLARLEQAMGRGDSSGVRKLMPGFLSLFKREPLLYCPPSDGGEPKDVLRAQTALHILEDLLTRLPRLGLLRESFYLTRLAREMERNFLPKGRRVSSFDQLFRIGLVGVIEAMVTADAEAGDEAGLDGPLADVLFKVTEKFQALWTEHSQTLRLSVLEAVADDDDWEPVQEFVQSFGKDLFTAAFLRVSSMRGILARGVKEWLDHEAEHGELEGRPTLIEAWDDDRVDRARTARSAEIVLQALIEHHDEYRDYSTTTTQSDYGENLHILLDLLRLKVKYDRLAWRLKPLAIAHEVLCRRGLDSLAQRWRDFIASKTRKLSGELLDELTKRETRYGIRLRSIRDRLDERFLVPLEIDRAASHVGPAAAAIHAGLTEVNEAFTRLLEAVEPLAQAASGGGIDVPVWVRRLEDALRESREPDSLDFAANTQLPGGVDFSELKRQLSEWDKPLGE